MLKLYHVLILAALPVQAAPITPADLGFAAQAPPIHITINVQVENLYIGEQPAIPPDPAPAVLNTPSCKDIMDSLNAIGAETALGVEDIYDRSTESELRGDPAGVDGANNLCYVQSWLPLRQ